LQCLGVHENSRGAPRLLNQAHRFIERTESRTVAHGGVGGIDRKVQCLIFPAVSGPFQPFDGVGFISQLRVNQRELHHSYARMPEAPTGRYSRRLEPTVAGIKLCAPENIVRLWSFSGWHSCTTPQDRATALSGLSDCEAAGARGRLYLPNRCWPEATDGDGRSITPVLDGYGKLKISSRGAGGHIAVSLDAPRQPDSAPVHRKPGSG
jgi:hypothetical protein